MTFPCCLTAESDGLYSPFNGSYCQHQFIDTVFTGTCDIVVVIMADTWLTAQVVLPAPAEFIAFANGLALYKMVTRLIFGQDQSPSVHAPCFGILTFVFVRARLREGPGSLGAVLPVCPCVSPGCA